MSTSLLTSGSSSSSGSSLVMDIDEQMHVDAEGNMPSVLPPNKPVFFIAHHDDDVKLIGFEDSCGGRVDEDYVIVTRPHEQEVKFETIDDVVNLSHTPFSFAVKWYGNQPGVEIVGRAMKVNMAPCVGKLSYLYKAKQFKHYFPAAITVGADDEFPVDVRAELEVKEG